MIRVGGDEIKKQRGGPDEKGKKGASPENLNEFFLRA